MKSTHDPRQGFRTAPWKALIQLVGKIKATAPQHYLVCGWFGKLCILIEIAVPPWFDPCTPLTMAACASTETIQLIGGVKIPLPGYITQTTFSREAKCGAKVPCVVRMSKIQYTNSEWLHSWT